MSDIDEEINLGLIKLLLLFILELLYFLLYIGLIMPGNDKDQQHYASIAGSSFQIPDRFAAFTLNV